MGVSVILPALLPATSIEEPNYIKAVPCLVCLRHKSELLNETLFSSLEEARAALADWRDDYNAVRPHSALANRTPEGYRDHHQALAGITGNGQNMSPGLSL